MNMNRVNEIATSFKSFVKDTYHKTEVLPELFALQSELVEKTFEEGTATSELKIWDVERRLDEMNTECGGVATIQIESFKKDCKYICNLIKAEISGNRGETKAFDSLSRIRGEHIILKNIELSNAESRSELDAVVITRNGAFIVEVKNTSRNIFIDEEGNYYRTGEFLRWDSNIGEKMQVKKNLLREVLDEKGLVDIPIYEIVVFTNNRVEVQNKCATLKTCFLSQLPYIIDKCRDTFISFSEMELVVQAVTAANIERSYPFEFDVEAFKMNFASILVTFEEAENAKEHSWFKTFIAFFNRKAMKYAQTAAAFAITVLSAISSVNGN